MFSSYFFFLFLYDSPFSFTLESIINWSFERFESEHPSSRISSLFICIVFFFLFAFTFLFFLALLFLYCFLSVSGVPVTFSFSFSLVLKFLPSQYLSNNLNFSISLPWRQFFPIKISFPFCFFVSIQCVPSVFLYTSTGINIQFGLFDLLNVFSILNFTLRFAISSGFWSFFCPLICSLFLQDICTLQLDSTSKRLFDLLNVSPNWINSPRDIFVLLNLLLVRLFFLFKFWILLFLFLSSGPVGCLSVLYFSCLLVWVCELIILLVGF